MVKDNNALIVDLLPKSLVTTHKHPRQAPAPTHCRPPETQPTAPENQKQGHHHAPAIYPTAPSLTPPPPVSLSLSSNPPRDLILKTDGEDEDPTTAKVRRQSYPTPMMLATV
ncbi:hypothetical protein RHMOL_Rhmol04G0189100 [Rhododendron molle]|uniref:Uncharacterized protein n=1 Tax=Rhododendron molle TaxID=49168 RepID=A0ACC0P1Y1_RHOML|nr:hypothetical protein RHMOL_Rhmol04G0189100 [Rhododendron molle]